MAAQGDPYSSFYEKLQLPHPLAQRFAVNAIFERLKSGPAHTGLQSPAGQEAFARCLMSTQPAVVDQTAKEICRLCVEGVLPVERGLRDLQSALDAVDSGSVASVINAIGFLCRIFLQTATEGTAFIGKSGDLLGVGVHPLVKALQSCKQQHQHVLQQVGILFQQASPKQQIITLEYLQPFITFSLLQPLVSSHHALLLRDLHSLLCLLTCQSHSRLLLKMLINYIQHYSYETAQGREAAMAAVKEVVDVWESLLKHPGLQQMKVEELEEFGSELLWMLTGLCHEFLSHKVSLYHALVLVKRLVKSLRLLSPAKSDSVGVNMVSMAHMLAIVDLEQEQLLLLELGLSWIEDVCAKGRKFGGVGTTTSPLLLVWVFPALHVMSYPSVAVKIAAMKLLQVLEKVVNMRHVKTVGAAEEKFISRKAGIWGGQHLSVVVCRLLHSMSSEETTAVNWVSGSTASTIPKGTSGEHWLRNLIAYLDRYRLQTSIGKAIGLSKGLLVSLCTLVTAFLLNSNVKDAVVAAEALASIGKLEPIWGMSLLPVVLYCVRVQGGFEGCSASEVQLGLLKVFPALACHSATLPLVLQALQPMLDSKSNEVVQATALRLLCKTWEASDRAFPHLQKCLRPGDITEAPGQNYLSRSRAACIRDVTRKDPDRGVDLVLSVQACIESDDPIVLSLGLQSLAILCKEDVVDFYTAWLVISGLFPILPSEPLVLQSLCMLLRYGALDAAAHPEAAAGVLKILWSAAATNGNMEEENKYSQARAMAFEGLSSYEVDDLETLSPDEKGKEVEMLLSEKSDVVLPFVEELLIKDLVYEHRERQRGQKEVKVPISKLGKVLKAFPGALNATGFAPASGKKVTSISDCPGAVLLCLSQPIPEKTDRISKLEFQKVVKTWQTNQEKIFLEAADHLQFGGNLVVAMLAFQSWCSFVTRWFHMTFTIFETERPNIGHQENLLRAAKYLVKVMQRSCEQDIPRVAESATLALAALCKAMPTQAHGISEEVSVFLELRLLQEGHEHMQWSAALALGIVATCLHTTDWNRKHEIVQLLFKYAGSSDRGIVKGACGLALGLICQSLLRRNNSSQLSEVSKQRETQTLVQIIWSLLQLTTETCPLAAPALVKLWGLLQSEVIAKKKLQTYPFPQEGPKLEEENFWAAVGLVWGIGSSVTGLQQLQCPLLLSAITDLMISWVSIFPIEHIAGAASCEGAKKLDVSQFFLAAGACLALSTCIEVSSRLEILTEEVNVLLQRVISLIACAKCPNNSAGIEQWRSSFSAVLYIGAGNLLATLLQDGVQSIKLELTQHLLGSMQAAAEREDDGAWSQLGAMIGIANSLGGGAASVVPIKRGQQLAELHMISRVQAVGRSEQSLLNRPLLDEAACEEHVLAIIKKLLGVVRNGQDLRVRSFAAWALAFVHNGFYGDGEFVGKLDSTLNEELLSGQARLLPRQSGHHMRALQDFPQESTLRQLCTKLWSNEQMESGNSLMSPQTLASVLRCLAKAPRLPALDWGSLTRRLFRRNQPKVVEEEHLVKSLLTRESKFTAGQEEVRQQCVLFAVAHAEEIPSLASFLDELSELSRLDTLEVDLRNLLMRCISRLYRIFSPLRLKQLFREVQEFAANSTSLAGFLHRDGKERDYQRCSFRISLWKGLGWFSEDADFSQDEKADEVRLCVEKCMTMLIDLLPTFFWTDDPPISKEADGICSGDDEWLAAIATLAKTQKTWLLGVFEVQISNLGGTQEKFEITSKAVFARCQLVVAGALSISDLKICCRWIMGHELHGLARLPVEVAWAVKEAPLEDKQELLLDCLDTAFISPYPSTAILMVALLASCWSVTAPLLSLKPTVAVRDLPLTLPSVLSQAGWTSTAGSIAIKVSLLFDRLGASLEGSSSDRGKIVWETVQVGEDIMSLSDLFFVLRGTCTGLKWYLPLETRLRIANLSIASIITE